MTANWPDEGSKRCSRPKPSSPLCVVGAVTTAAAAVATAIRLIPDLVLLDVSPPDGSGFDACRQILAQLPAPRIIVLTAPSTDSYLPEPVTSGVHGCPLKKVYSASPLRANQEVSTGGSILGSDVTARVLKLWRGGNSAPRPDLATSPPRRDGASRSWLRGSPTNRLAKGTD